MAIPPWSSTLRPARRGSRHEHLTGMLRELTGAEAVQIVNNNAAALFLSLATLAAPGEVIVSRGQAVEIGGGFPYPRRLPTKRRLPGGSRHHQPHPRRRLR